MDKVYVSVEEAIAEVFEGATIMFGGFWYTGFPSELTLALVKKGTKKLTVIAQSVGVGNDLDILAANGQIRKAIVNYAFFPSPDKITEFERQLRAHEVKCETYPMGSFIEKIRAGGAGIAGFYTPTGLGTVVAQGKEHRFFDGREYILEEALRADFAFVHAHTGDRKGNLVYRKAARNYNPEMAMAGTVTIAEVENLVELGELDPDCIHTPGIYVQRVVKVERPNINFSFA
jgi:3-oxoacid CoA-transferase subunit A